MRYLAAVALWVLAWPTTGLSTEFVDGQNNSPTQRNNMHSCPPGFVVTGVHVDNNWLLCEGPFSFPLVAPPPPGISNEVADFGVTADNQFPYTAGRTMHWCGSLIALNHRMVTGVHVDQNGFGCANYVQRDGTVLPVGTPFIDGGGESTPTQRSGMHACPVGTVLVGAFFDDNAFLCAQRNYCTTDGQVQCPPGRSCVIDTPPGSEISSLTGTCQ